MAYVFKKVAGAAGVRRAEPGEAPEREPQPGEAGGPIPLIIGSGRIDRPQMIMAARTETVTETTTTSEKIAPDPSFSRETDGDQNYVWVETETTKLIGYRHQAVWLLSAKPGAWPVKIPAIWFDGRLVFDALSASSFIYSGIEEMAIFPGTVGQAAPAILGGGVSSDGGNYSTSFGTGYPTVAELDAAASAAQQNAYEHRVCVRLRFVWHEERMPQVGFVVATMPDSGSDQLLEFEPVLTADGNINPTVAGPYLSADGKFAWAIAHRNYTVDDPSTPTEQNAAVLKYNAATGALISDTPITVSASVTGKAASNFEGATAAAVLSGIDHYDYIHVPGGDGWLIVNVDRQTSPFNAELCVIDPATAEIVAFLDADIEGGFSITGDTCWQKRDNGSDYFVAGVHGETLKVMVFDPAAETFALWRDKDWSSELFHCVCERHALSHAIHDGAHGKLFLDEYDATFDNYTIFQYEPKSDTRTPVISGAGKVVLRMWALADRIYIIWDQVNNNFTKAWRPGTGSGGETHTIDVDIGYSPYVAVNGGATQSILIGGGSSNDRKILLKGDAPGLFYYIDFGASSPQVQTFDFSDVEETPLLDHDTCVWYASEGFGMVCRGGASFAPSFDNSEAGPVKIIITGQVATITELEMGEALRILAEMNWVASGEFDGSEITTPVNGLALTSGRYDLAAEVDRSKGVGDYGIDEAAGVIRLKKLPTDATAADFVLSAADLLGPEDGRGGRTRVPYQRLDLRQIPRTLELHYFNIDNYLTRAVVRAHVEGSLSTHTEMIQSDWVAAAVTMQAALDVMASSLSAAVQEYAPAVTREHVTLAPFDIVEFTHGEDTAKGVALDASMASLGTQELRVVGLAADKSAEGAADAGGYASSIALITQATVSLDMDMPLWDAATDPAGAGLKARRWLGPKDPYEWVGGSDWNAAAEAGPYTEMASRTARPFHGKAKTVLPAWPRNGGVDRTNALDVEIHGGSSGDLGTITAAAMLAGGVVLAYGVPGRWEIVYPQVVTALGSGQYRFTNIARGQRGTHAPSGLHAADDWVLLVTAPSVLDEYVWETGQLGDTIWWKAVGADQHPAVVAAASETLAGAPQAPWEPTGHAAAMSGADVAAAWKRVARFPAATALNQPPLTETSELYTWRVFDGATQKREVTGLTSPAYTYLEADQVTDFGAGFQAGDTITFEVLQVQTLDDAQTIDGRPERRTVTIT